MPTLEQIEGDVWPQPAGETTLMRKCRLLRSKDINDFTVEDYRVLVGQGISLPILAPRVIGMLKNDPLLGGAFYEGDLLNALFRESNWRELHAFEAELAPMCVGVLKLIDLDDPAPSHCVLRTSIEAYLQFLGK